MKWLRRFFRSINRQNLFPPRLLFDEMERTEIRPKNEREPFFPYYNISARKPITAVRAVFQQWYESFPRDGRKDLRARFRSPIDSQHLSAFWELYLHELFSGMGFGLTPHPVVQGSANHPDFLVSEQGTPRFYLEATVAGLPSSKEAGAEARLAEVLDLVNRMQTPDYFLEVQHRGIPNTPPPVRKLRHELSEWLNSLDINALAAVCTAGDFDSLPRFEWPHDGLTLVFRPIPKSPAKRGTTDARPIGITMGEVKSLTTDQDIRVAIEAKAKKYGTLLLPLVVAVNVVSDHCDEIDINDALFGSETFLVTLAANGSHFTESAQRKPNGVWFGKGGPRNETVAAVLIASDLNPYTATKVTPVLIHNPYFQIPLALKSYTLPQSVPDQSTQTMKKKDGKRASDYLRLPSPWPPEMD